MALFPTLYFNPLQREAGDRAVKGNCIRIRQISIHSSAKPETRRRVHIKHRVVISIHSSVKPETGDPLVYSWVKIISIHSSVKPETAIITNFYLYPTHFLIQINQYFIFSTPFLHQSPYHNAPFPVRIP